MTRSRFSVGLLVSLLGINLVTFLTSASRTLGKPYELMHGEGFTWYLAGLIGRGLPLYPEVGPTQLVTNPHTPIYMLITGGLSVLVGDSLLTGRLVTLVSGFLILGLVFLIVRKLTGNPWAGLIGALLVTSLTVFRFLSVLYRMDTLGVVFALAGIYIFMKFEGRGKLLYWSIPLFLLAFFTKQNFIAAPIAACIYLLVKDWRLALRYIGILIGVLVGSLVIGGLLTGGQMLVHNFLYIWYALGEGDGWTDWSLPREVIVYYLPLWVGVGAYFGYKWIKRNPVTLVEVYFLVSFSVLAGLIGKGGSSFHYGLESLVVASILMGILVARMLKIFNSTFLVPPRKLVWGLVIVLLAFQSIGVPFGRGYAYQEYIEGTDKAVWEIVEYVETSGKPSLSYLYTNVMLAENGSDSTLYDPALLIIGNLIQRDHFGWDQSEVVRRLETGYFGIVMLDFDIKSVYGDKPKGYEYIYLDYPRVTDEMANAIIDNYDLVYTSDYMGSPFYPYQSFLFEYIGDK